MYKNPRSFFNLQGVAYNLFENISIENNSAENIYTKAFQAENYFSRKIIYTKI